jgi:hypothetical protein
VLKRLGSILIANARARQALCVREDEVKFCNRAHEVI